MAGEELPPVVVALEGDDSSFLEMLARDVEAAQVFAADLEAALAEGFGGLQISGAEITSEGIGQAGAVIGEELSQGITEGVGALDLEPELGRSLGDPASIGADAGEAITAGMESGTQGATMVGAEISDMLRAGLAQGLPEVDAEVQSVIQQLPSIIDPAATYAGLHIGTALSGALGAGLSAGSSLAAAAIVGPLTAASIDAAAQAGAAAGGALTAAIGDGAAVGAAPAATQIASAMQASLTDALTQEAGSAGAGLLAGIAQGVAQGADETAQKIADSLQPPLESSMTEVGAGAGDAFNAGFASATGGGSGGGEGGGAAFIDFAANNEQVVEQQAAELGDKAAVSYSTAWEARYGAIPHGTDIADVLGMQNQQDTFVPNLAEGEGAWILASKTGAKDAADAAWQAYGQELAGLVVSPAQFAAMTDGGIEAWQQEVAARAAASGEGFATAFADAITMGMAGIDWSALSGAQASALGNAMRGIVAEVEPEAVAEMESVGVSAVAALQAGVQSTGSAVADGLIAQIVEARQAAIAQLVELAVAAADEGEQAGSTFGRFFSQAADAVRVVFSKDPEKAAEAGAEAGREYAGAMIAELEAQLGETPQAAAEEGAAAGSAFGRFFSSAASGVLAVFARDPAKAGGAEAGIEFGDAMLQELEARLATLGEAGGEAFAQLVEQQLEAQLTLAAAEATAAYEQQLTDGMAAAEAAAAAQVGEMRMDTNVDAMFSNLTQTLPAEFVDAFSTMRAGIALTEEEFAQFSESGQRQIFALATLIQTEGVGAADEFAQALSTRVFNERLDPTSLMAGAGSEAEGLASELGGVEKATAGATSGFGGMASMMYGPLRGAIYPLMLVLPLLGGALSGLAHAFDPAQATLLNVQSLAQSLSTDGNAAGEATAAFVAQSAATDGLSASASRAGVSLVTWTEAVVGNTAAQQNVTDAVGNLNAAQLQQGETSLSAATSTGKFSDEQKGAEVAAIGSMQATNQLTAANQALMNSMHAQSDQIVSQIDQQAQLSQATQVLDQQTSIYDASVNALGQAMVTQVTQTQMSNQATAQFGSQVLFAESSVSYMTQAMAASVATGREQALTSAEASVGLLNLGSSQTVLNAQLVGAESAYAEAQQGAGAYNTALSALNGTENTLLGSEASFTTSLAGLTTAVKTNGDSLDVNTTKGAANITAITGIATAAQAAAVAVYQNEVQTVGANQAYADATTKLGQEKEAFIQAADKAGLNKTQVQQLANELFKLPPNIQVDVGVNTNPAEQGLTDLIRKINSSGATVTVYETSTGTVGTTQTKVQAKASGGPVEAGQLYHVNESGAEGFWTAPANGYIIPHEQFASIGSGGGGYSPAGGSSGGGGGAAPTVNVTVLLDGREITASVRSEAQWYKSHNSQTGFA